MALDGKLLSAAREQLAQRRAENAALLEQHEAQAYAKAPQLREIDARARRLLAELVKLTAERPAEADRLLAELQQRWEALTAEKAAALAAAGLPADWLELPCDCPVCHDSGYLPSGAVCDCLRALYEAEQTKALNAALRLSHESFADFSLDYYKGVDREIMELVYNTCLCYVENFAQERRNLLFRGGTGLGKTLLSGCIAKALAAQGFSVAYETATDAFAAFEEQKFSREGERYAEACARVHRILDCELLILDDLGTELTTSFTQSALYQIVNARLIANRPTIISTNLSEKELRDRYLPQTVSRLEGEYDVLGFVGSDVRAQKKARKYS